MAALPPHQARPIRFIERRQMGQWRLKFYGIATAGRVPRAELLEAAMDLAPKVFPRPASGDGRHGIGFVVVHDAATVCFALYYWWQSTNELHQRVYLSPLDQPRALAQVSDPAAGCVWELEVIDFERRAWLRDVLANPAGPDLEAYLACRCEADV